jgi:glycine/D-amino acid oxidase-like deaminating enzyme
MTITVVGGGLAGLIAAIECAERGEDVVVKEATSLLGGRARSTTGDYVANHGPHVVYDDGALWAWLDARGLAEPAGKAPLTRARFVHGGKVRRTPPLEALRLIRLVRGTPAPDDASFRLWVAANGGDPELASRLCHVFTFSDDPGRWAASFVAERMKRAFTLPPIARYVPGGWATLVDRVVGRARDLGVRIETNAKVTSVPAAPVIVATSLDAARRLLEDETINWTGARTALLDLGLRARRGDPFVVIDLDTGVFVERYSAPDPTLAPPDHSLVQAQVGLGAEQSLEDGVRIMEAVLDATGRGWRERETWRRRQVITDASGALDPPGTTWRDRPAIDRGNGVFLCGDMVAAPGLLGEVSCTSAVTAAEEACNFTRRHSTKVSA